MSDKNFKIMLENALGQLDRRTFLKGAAAAGVVSLLGVRPAEAAASAAKVKIIVIGGGAAGLGMAARLRRKLPHSEITVIDPAERQYYQPGFTLIGSGVYTPKQVWHKQSDCMPKGVKWVKKAVIALEPAANSVIVTDNEKHSYDFLVLTPGLQLNWELVEGLSRKTLGEGNVHSIYDFEGSQKMWTAMQAFVAQGGRGIFTDTYTKHKCGGAPKKICLLTEHLARKRKTRESLTLDYFTGSKQLYDVPFFTPRLEEIYKERNVSVTTRTHVTGVDTAAKKAFLKQTEIIKKEVTDPLSGETKSVEESVAKTFTESYDILHLAPPQSAPDFVRQAGLGWSEGSLAPESWVMVDKDTLVHKTFPNIVSLGDVAGIPTSKTSAAVRKQVPVALRNLLSLIEGRAPEAVYNGYAACPIITDYGHVLMAEFDYDKKPQISFPLSMFDMSKESRMAWMLKVYVLKPLYFYGMIPGYW
ncbi:MAG: FAD-dependent oxidoreductase [Kiritimatiellae bacterium]|nr:FAD-dependent oxidoreductase [Kiritimatiellia bacterium]